MSQERTRFPIQPDERRRSARSSENVKAVPDEMPDERDTHEDKPAVPPHRRNQSPEEEAED
jgi:hypothetical protein